MSQKSDQDLPMEVQQELSRLREQDRHIDLLTNLDPKIIYWLGFSIIKLSRDEDVTDRIDSNDGLELLQVFYTYYHDLVAFRNEHRT